MVVLGGLGHHYASLSDIQQTHYNKTSFAAQILYALTLGCVKLSILLMLQRIFSLASNTFRLAAYAATALAICWMLQTILVALLLCRPVQKLWDPVLPGSCGNSVSQLPIYILVDSLACSLLDIV